MPSHRSRHLLTHLRARRQQHQHRAARNEAPRSGAGQRRVQPRVAAGSVHKGLARGETVPPSSSQCRSTSPRPCGSAATCSLSACSQPQARCLRRAWRLWHRRRRWTWFLAVFGAPTTPSTATSSGVWQGGDRAFERRSSVHCPRVCFDDLIECVEANQLSCVPPGTTDTVTTNSCSRGGTNICGCFNWPRQRVLQLARALDSPRLLRGSTKSQSLSRSLSLSLSLSLSQPNPSHGVERV